MIQIKDDLSYMNSLLKALAPHVSNVIGVSFCVMVIAMLLSSPAISYLLGVFLITPLSISILRNQPVPFLSLLKKVVSPKSLYYAVLFISLWIVPICVPAFISHWVNSDVLFVFLVSPLYSFLFAKMSPTFVEIATGVKGVKILANDMLIIMLTMVVYSAVETLFDYLYTVDASLALISLPGLCLSFVLTFCLQTAIVLLRNRIALSK